MVFDILVGCNSAPMLPVALQQTGLYVSIVLKESGADDHLWGHIKFGTPVKPGAAGALKLKRSSNKGSMLLFP